MFFCLLVLLTIFSSAAGLRLDHFHCRTATCNEFFYGLRQFPHPKDYVDVCHSTITALEEIPVKHGKCFNEQSKQFNPSCIYALAETMKTCIGGLKDVPEKFSQHFCGHRLMQNCARHVGLERFPYKADYRHPNEQ